MKVSRQTCFRVTAVIVALATFLIFTGSPAGRVYEAKQAESLLLKKGRARTMPVSAKMITVRFTQDDNEPVQASQLEGGLIRIEKAGKSVYGFTPIISDVASGTVEIKVFLIDKVSGANKVVEESLVEVQTLTAGKASNRYYTSYVGIDSSFKIEVVDVQTEPEPGMQDLTAEEYVEMTSGCCAECGGVITCACAVSTPCGGCCEGACCRRKR